MKDLVSEISSLPLGKTFLIFAGQAGFIVRSKSGILLGIDLYLSDCVERTEGHVGFKRLLPKIINPIELELDILIATHPHLDHFDVDSVPFLMSNNKTRLYCSVECEKYVKKLQLEYYGDRIKYVRPKDSFIDEDFKIIFVNCDHGLGAPDAVGVLLEVDGKIIYEAGDTCLRLDRKNEVSEYGDVDVMIAPINGAYGNIDEEDCFKLTDCLKPRAVIPCHYGMFASHGGNPGLFYDIMKKNGLEDRLLFMGYGEIKELL